jgi:hypothetical protein
MRRILVTCGLLAVLALPAATAAGASAPAKPGYVVVRNALDDGGVNGRPVVTVVVKGFVLGRVSQQGRIAIYGLPNQTAPKVSGTDLSTRPVHWHGFTGTEWRGSNFRFRAAGGFYRVVVRGSGVYLFAGGKGHVKLRGSSYNRRADGTFSVNGGTWASLPTRSLTRKFGGG